MSATKIDLHRQGLAATLTDTEVASGAAINITKLNKTVIAADGSNTFSANQSMGSNRLTSVADPTNPQDAATKNYVDSNLQGLSPKASVVAATAAVLPANTYANGTLGVGATLTATSNAALTVDGVSVSSGNRVLVQNEAAPANNGIYTVTQVGSGSLPYILTRTTDANIAADIPGAYVFTEAGTVNAGAGFVVATAGPFTMGTTAITFTQFSGAGEITAGTGLVKSGNTISINGPVSVANGGTGNSSLTAYAVMAAGTTSTGALQQVSGLGTSGWVLTSNGAGALPSWQAAATSKTFNRQTVTGAINGSNTSYTLGVSPNPTGSEQIIQNGLILNPGSGNDYTISGATVTFLTAPATGDIVQAFCSS